MLHALDFPKLTVADIMCSADELVTLDINAPFNTNLQIITEQRFSRYPVYQDNISNIIGLLHVKDLSVQLHNSTSLENLQELIRPILTVKRNTSITKLLEKFRKSTTHFAIVTNDAGRLIGFITLDNVLGALIGHIHDEFHQTKKSWRYAADGSLLFKGNTPLFALERALSIELENHQADTISGFIMNHLERLPVVGEKIQFEFFSLEIIKMTGPKILLVKVNTSPKETTALS